MKLIRFGEPGKEKPGVILDEGYYDVSALTEDYNERFFEEDGLSLLQKFIAKNKKDLPAVSKDIRLGSPIARPSKIICIGLNYADHARETGAAIPVEP